MVMDHPVFWAGLLACAAALDTEALGLDRWNHKRGRKQHMPEVAVRKVPNSPTHAGKKKGRCRQRPEV
jgi:hypothetical protein